MRMAIKRGSIVVIGVIMQIFLSVFVLLAFGQKIAFVEGFYSILSVLLVLGIIKESKSLSKDLPWIIIIMVFPIIGALLYIVIGGNLKKSKILKSINKSEAAGMKYLVQEKSVKEEIENQNNGKLKYLMNYLGFPVTKNNDIKYYPFGELAYKDMLEELKQAKKFIFLEYFIIKKGKMWDEILNILEQKASEGIEIRLIYDDMGCIAFLPSDYPKKIEEKGIKCIAFNKLNPFLGVILNNRDHRKMMIIDGKTVFSGGMNLADEYINIEHPYGVWKDNGIRIKGDAVWNFTVMFLNMWNSYRNQDKNYKKYKYNFKEENIKTNGYLVPYGESPLDNEITGENVYLNLINQAEKYVYIFTPYLIIDTDMINSIILASKRGVDVRMVVPGIPDKKIVYSLTTSYFETLIKNGIKIYKYTPGFVHSKVFVSDDKYATVGTINLDYRSLYLHFECGVFMQDVKEISDVKKDLVDAIAESHLVTKNEATPRFLKGLWQAVLRLFAPLM